MLFLLQQYFHRSPPTSLSSDTVKFKAGMSGLMPCWVVLLPQPLPLLEIKPQPPPLQGAWAGLAEEGWWGAQGAGTGVGSDLDRSPSAPLPPCLLDVRRPLEEQNKPVNRGFALDDPMCPENQSRRAPVILKPPRGSSCTSGPAGRPPCETTPRPAPRARSEGRCLSRSGVTRPFWRFRAQNTCAWQAALGPWPEGARLVWRGTPDTSHQQPRQGKARGQSSASQSHSFTYTENSSNLLQNCLVSS